MSEPRMIKFHFSETINEIVEFDFSLERMEVIWRSPVIHTRREVSDIRVLDAVAALHRQRTKTGR